LLWDSLSHVADRPEPGRPGADLTEADLTGANLAQANLSNANLTDAKLNDEDLTGIHYDRDTVWPDCFKPPPSRANP
jgi:hypothetical protein